MNGMSSSTGQAAQDPERRVIRIGGAEAADFLQSILTSDMEALSPGETRASALLTLPVQRRQVVRDHLMQMRPLGKADDRSSEPAE